jgi:thiol-disulfide isomerase/thioredoxin
VEAEENQPAEPPFAARIGLLLSAPAHAMAEIVRRKSGGVRDALVLVFAAGVVFRLPELIRAARAFSRVSTSAALTQIVGVFGAEVRTAAFVALLSAFAIVVLAGRGRRDPSLALELGGACYVPYFFAWAPVRLVDLDAWLGYVPTTVSRVVRVVAWAWVLAMVGFAVLAVRREPVPSSPSLLRRGRYVGLGALALPALALVLNIVWSAQHYNRLRPLGRTDEAPDFVLDRIDGKPGPVRLSDLRGQVVLLDFWATWCPPCLAMMPTLHELYRDWHPRGAEFVGIDSDGPMGSRDDVRDLVARHPFPYPVVIDDRNAGGAYGVSSIPHIVIIGRDGKIARVFVGGVGRQQLDAALTAAGE